MKVTHSLAIAGLLNIVALTIHLVGNAGWLYKMSNNELSAPTSTYLNDAPLELKRQRNDDAAANGIIDKTKVTRDLPSYLAWEESNEAPPEDWSFHTPKNCPLNNKFHYNHSLHSQQKIIVHYHMQHNAGTQFYLFARKFTPCATQACWQNSKHCMVSNKEEVEAENLRQNYRKYGVQYVSYEFMLPPRFPMPFVSEDARRGMFFTTIMRDPFKRFFTYYRNHKFNPNDNGKPLSPYWIDLHDGKQLIYSGDNLNLRWLAGTRDHITTDHINIAKCRLQLFDLVIADTLYDHAVKKVLCPLNNWRGKQHCDNTITNTEHKSKPNPLNGTDPILIGGWIERLRPSFEIYDYARILSWKQLRERGVKDLPELSEVPSFMATLAKYTGMEVTDEHFKKITRVSLRNEDHFHPPVEFCDRMKRVWTSNPDELPSVYGIGSLKGWSIQ